MRQAVRFGLFVVLTVAIAGAQTQTITLNRAIELAMERNYTIKQAVNAVERDQAGVLSAYGNFTPTLNLNSSWGGGQQFVNGVGIGNADDRNISTSLSAGLTIFDGFTNTSSFTAAKATASSSEFALNRTRQSVASQTQRLYYEVLRTRRLLEVSQLNLKYSTQQLDRVRETARLGSASLVNVYQQQAQVGQDELRVVQSESDYALAKANLSAYLALDVTDEAEFADPTIVNEIDEVEFQKQKSIAADLRGLVDQAMERRTDYLSSREAFAATDASVTQARSGYYPRLSASASYSLTGRTQRDLLTKVVTASEFENFGVSRSFSWGLSLSLPIYSGFRTNESVQRALVARKNAEEGLRETERKIQVEVKTALLQLESAQKSYEAAVKSLQYQEQNLKVSQEKYNVGSGTLLDLLFAQNNFTNAQVTRINAVYQYLNAKSQFELAVGSLPQ
jgi:outer membrane protein